MKIPCVKKPCKDCPYRKDSLKGWLGEKRMTEFLNTDSFLCHKNTSLQCAGHMILKKNGNIFVRAAKIYKEDLKLKGEDLIFDTEQQCIEHHKFND